MDFTAELKVGDRVEYYHRMEGSEEMISSLGIIIKIINDKDCFETEHNHPKFEIINEKNQAVGVYSIREISSKIDHPGYPAPFENVLDAF